MVQINIDNSIKFHYIFFSIADLSNFRPVYGPKDFLDMLTTIKHPNVASSGQASATQWGLLNLPLKVNNLQQLVS